MHARIFLVRHGATVLTAEDRFAGATNVQLSDEGREQVRRLAARLQGESIAAIYASPLDRTVETAGILAEPHGLEVQMRDGLREISHGRWEQMTRKEVEQAFPDEAAAWEKDPYTFAPVGGESARVTGPDGYRPRASRFQCAGRFAQGDDSSAAQFVTGIRPASLPR